ncbi:MAG: LysR family transcriptional regulator [Deltaproteobacteria bacterium]|nr:LysR family transcriptional regulator [Deltaproteobacteria bacterium]
MLNIEKRIWLSPLRINFMTLHQLKIFAAVAKHLNITKASREIQVSQPSVSKQLRLLENEYGLRFYVKSGRGIRLTEEGQLFHVRVKPILEQLERLKRTFESRVAEGRAKSLIVGSSPAPAFFLSAVLKSFVELHPTVHPTLRTGYPHAIKEMVLNAEVEIALTITHPDHPQIIAEPIHSEEIVAVVSARHPLAKKRKLNDAELAQAPFVIMKGGRIAEEIEKMGLKLNVVMWCDSIEPVKEYVRAGLGIGLFYRGSAEAGIRGGYFKIIEIPRLKDIRVTYFVVYRKGMPLSANTQDLLTLLRQWSKKPIALH